MKIFRIIQFHINELILESKQTKISLYIIDVADNRILSFAPGIIPYSTCKAFDNIGAMMNGVGFIERGNIRLPDVIVV
ncbi:MAG: hypothetical protein IKV23_06195 [Bacteroidaceae bacterium]|nr:hypothetical protein [Bacteroidaceae bacterium]